MIGAGDAHPRPEVGISFSARGMWEAPFWNLAAAAGYRHLHRTVFESDVGTPPGLEDLGGHLEFSDGGDTGRCLWVYAFERGAYALLAPWSRQLTVLALAATPGAARDVVRDIRGGLESPAPEDGSIAMTYWSATTSGPRVSTRRLSAPGWETIAGNYPREVRQALDPLMTASDPESARLLLWHGQPGTGKTTALRALAEGWRAWADVHYVVDPEKLVGDAGYLADVLVGSADRAARESRTALLVLEDSGELMAPQARQDTGQGLSRLLNLSDGMLGQDLDLVVLITTNEPIGSLHPAVSRPGRCWAQVDFPAHTRTEANEWLAARGSEVRVREPATLAELFALERGLTLEPPRRAIGFAA